MSFELLHDLHKQFELVLVHLASDCYGSHLLGVDRYVRLGRAESTTLEAVSRGMRLSAMPWIVRSPARSGAAEAQSESSPFDPSALLRAFLLWVYSDVINQILRSCFYITEGESYGNEVRLRLSILKLYCPQLLLHICNYLLGSILSTLGLAEAESNRCRAAERKFRPGSYLQTIALKTIV